MLGHDLGHRTDYGWIRSSSSLFKYALEVGYTLTLVRGVSPSELRGEAETMTCRSRGAASAFGEPGLQGRPG
jgi:hypothetical protein